jgi:hypothetical protein
MKTKNFPKYLITIIAVGLIYTACKKDRIQEKSLNAYSSPNNYLNSKEQAEQTFTIDTNGTGPIVGNQGTNIWMGKSCLMFPNGDSVYYPFTVKLVELYTPKDMIYYQMPTVASDTILETAGEIRLRAFKNGTELLLRPGCSDAVKMPNASPQNYMRVFYGYQVSNYINWTDNPVPLGVTGGFIPAFGTTSGGYLGSIARLGWINCDVTRGGANNHTLSFVSSTDILTNVAIFVYFPATKTVMQVYNVVSGSIPDGSAVKIVAIAVDANGNLFSFSQNLTVSSSSQIQVTMSGTTDAALTSLLNAL